MIRSKKFIPLRVYPASNSKNGGHHSWLTECHPLAELGPIFNRLSSGGQGVGGSGITVSNTGFDPNYLAVMRANYRLVADLSDDPPGLWAVDASGQSGNPGSVNYCDQLESWMQNSQNFIPLDRKHVDENTIDRLIIQRSP